MSILPSISGSGIVKGLGTAVSALALAVGSLLVLKDASRLLRCLRLLGVWW